MGRLFTVDLEPEGNVYICKHCLTPLALYDDFLYNTLHRNHGNAYLFDKVANISLGMKEEKLLIYQWQVVVDLFCVRCGSPVGLKILAAKGREPGYREDKFILESIRVVGPHLNDNVVHHEEQNGSEESGDEDV